MNGEHRTELLSAGQLARLIEAHRLQVEPTSPLAPFAGVASAPDETPVDGLLDAGWSRALAVLAAPDRQVRTIIAGPADTLVQLYYGRAEAPRAALVGCWLEGDRMRVSFPWTEEDVAAVAARVVLATLPPPVDEPDLVLGVTGLAALAAAVDAVRSRLFVSLAERNPAVDAWFGLDEIGQQVEAGAASADARWLVTLLRLLAPPDVAVPAEPIGPGLEELAAAGMLVVEDGRWTPSPALLGYASRWVNPLPAVAHEVIETAGARLVRYGYRIALRGSGPLTVIDVEDALGEPRVTLRTVDPIGYLDDLVRLLRPGSRPEADVVTVAEPIAVRGPQGPSQLVGTLQPGRRYAVRDRRRGWAWVSDTDGPLEGWVPEGSLHPIEVAPSPTPRAVVRDAAQVLALDGGSRVVGTLPAGSVCLVVGTTGGWAHVRAAAGALDGWVDQAVLRPEGEVARPTT
ncbi:MAG: hypothetical protein MUF83_15580 [Acidimicrobiales bacterium]|jgi:hypothetical protein|nr:hypothetical protein [Acidimicrobiales bacterium]